ncbi:MAG: LD-carboxypeptidase [Desulfobulbus propionicus]|nr:MAG: LD-carboxypeptidase [Desulfobulbus propionicus]
MINKPALPPFLRKNDTIGLTCPAGPVRDKRLLNIGTRIIEDMGFQVIIKGAFQYSGHYLADRDEQRAKSLLSLWSDEKVKAIMAIRGGFGSMRLLPHLNMERLQQRPKMLIGFSDISALLSGLTGRGNMTAVHGPVVTSLARLSPANLEQVFSLLTGNLTDIKAPELEILRKGEKVRGKLIGGNLTTLVHLINTPWDCAWDDCILLLEDTGEALYRLDRMLTQLALSGRFDNLAGILLGSFDTGHDNDALNYLRTQEYIWQRILELTAHTLCPVWGNFPSGHYRDNYALPLGMDASMNSRQGLLHLHPDSVLPVY